jgi:hypothetical protein
MILSKITPLESFIIIMLLVLIPTWFIYVVIGKVVERNFSHIKGTIGSFTIELGGPVAFYFIVLFVFAKNYIPPYEEITITGAVKDVDGTALGDYYIGSVALQKADEQGRFLIRAQRNENDTYDFVITTGPARVISQVVKDQKDILINNFPDPKITKILAKTLIDQKGRKLPDGYKVIVEPNTHPNPSIIQTEGELEPIEIENGQYDVVFYDTNGRERAREHMPDVYPGNRVYLHIINLKE